MTLSCRRALRATVPALRLPAAARPTRLTHVIALGARGRLGYVPLLALFGAIGLMIVALGDTFGRLEIPGAPLLFWIGLLAILLPSAIRLLGRDATRVERATVVALLAMGLYLVKVLHSPAAFSMFDEFHHWATLDDIVVSGHLFTHNNILPASPYYPGLEVVASALVRSGLSAWEAGVLVIGAGRLLFALSLFLFMERVAVAVRPKEPARLAGLAVLIYMANPSFLFFDAQFAYESLALPLAAFVLWTCLRRDQGRSGRIGMTVVLVLTLAAVVVTHHITSIALAVFLVAWAVVDRALPVLARRWPAMAKAADSPGDALGVTGPALMAVTATAGWMLYVASITVGYLAPAFDGALNQVLDLIAGEEGGRELFRAASGVTSPALEQLFGYGSVVVVVLALPISGLVLWRRGRADAVAVTLGLTALLYPATLIARLTPRGAEIAARSSEFTFIGVGFVVAVGALELLEDPRLRGYGMRAVMTGLIVLLVGGAVLAFPFWARIPGPYLVSADPRSVEPEGIAAASWMLDHLGVDNRLMTDRTNRALTATYGRQHPISAVGDGVDVKPAYFATSLDPDLEGLLGRAKVRYVEVDRRLPMSLPYVGVYVERGEVNSGGPWTAPMPAAALEKWDATVGADRIFDSGDLQLYDLRLLVAGPR